MSRSKAVRYYSEEQVKQIINHGLGRFVDGIDENAFADFAAITAEATKRTPSLSLRPEVAAFAQAMEEKLRQNDHKGHWKDCTREYLWHRFMQESAELYEAIFGPAGGDDAATRSEGADVGNLVMMLLDRQFALRTADVMGGLKP